jgi:sialate O-acetylesterase
LLELQKPGEEVRYVFAAMDAFTDDLKKTGVPVMKSGARFMQQVTGLTVRSNVDDVVPCTNSGGGNIEFWPGNYGPINELKIPGASSKVHDFGDMANEKKMPGCGCLQVHNWQNKQAVFALNHWNAGGVEAGIGNCPTGAPDWTFSKNGTDYILRRLTVMVK